MSIRHNTSDIRSDLLHEQQQDRDFDAAMRRRYGESLVKLPAGTHARLRAARHAAATRPAPALGFGTGWKVAGAFAAVFAFAIGLKPLISSSPAPAATQVASAPVSDIDLAVAALDENPDLYLWLAANDDALPPFPE